MLDAGKTVPLDDLVVDDRPITYGILKPGSGFPGGIPVVKVKDMRDGVIDQSDLLLTTPELDYQYRRRNLPLILPRVSLSLTWSSQPKPTSYMSSVEK